MPGGRDSTIVKLEFSSGVSVPPPQAFTVLKDNGVETGEIEMLQALEARNTYDLKFKSDAARVKGVSCLKGVEGLTVTPYDGSVAVTVLYLPFEVDQRLVARVLSQYGTVSEMRWCKYTAGELKGIFNGKRQFRMELVRDIPSFLFIGGSKAHIRYFCQPRTCFRCGEEGHEAKSCPNRRCGKCLQLGHGKAECPNEVRCNLCGEVGHVFGSCPTSYSAHVSADVGSAPEPSQTGPQYSTQKLEEAALEVEQDFLASKQCEEGTGTPEADCPPSLAAAPGQVEIMTLEEDLDLSSDSAMSDGGPQSLLQRIRLRGRVGLICVRGRGQSALKRSASGEVSDRGTHTLGRPYRAHRLKR
ncbi:Zinc finger CCHC domain-containing protein 3 [Holothuria leucospilota]|uniref:Zinc finger CCHC domain-containing protein 3 n=1 Tax=Holothuria leucospilota TaxID=206669 RepID=A0A9Q1HL38_HOLLE|nr:Zinc finger CCHC domain-containing protein 3 [Holothuria leucospilota]